MHVQYERMEASRSLVIGVRNSTGVDPSVIEQLDQYLTHGVVTVSRGKATVGHRVRGFPNKDTDTWGGL